MTVVRKAKRKRFVVIDKGAVDDKRLSAKALGWLVRVLSKPDDWSISIRQFAREYEDGLTTVMTAFRELEAAGYLVREQRRDQATGKFEWDAVVYESPEAAAEAREEANVQVGPRSGYPDTEDPRTDDPDTENPTTTNKGWTEDSQTNNGGTNPPTPQAPSLALVAQARPSDEPFALFEYWQTFTGRRRAVFSPKRRRLAVQAIRTYGLDYCTRAVEGWQYSPFHRGENDRGTVYNDFELIFRDSQQIERFYGYADGSNIARPTRNGKTDWQAIGEQWGTPAIGGTE